MPETRAAENLSRTALRLWPGVLLVVLQWLIRFVVPAVAPDSGIIAVIGGVAGGAAVLIWWLFFSRAPWAERLGALVLMAGLLYVTSYMGHESVANGMMGMMLPVFAAPLLSLALVGWAVASRSLQTPARWAAMAAAFMAACAAATLVRTGGISGDGVSDLHWRWTETPEQRLLARDREEPSSIASAVPPAAPAVDAKAAIPDSAAPAAPAAPAPRSAAVAETPHAPAHAEEPESLLDLPATPGDAEWPGFRGAGRDGIVKGVSIATDWSRTPPVELWRKPIGPGWSSFAVH